MEVAAGHRAIVAGLDHHVGLGCCLLLHNRSVYHSLRLLLLRAELGCLHGCEGLLLPELVLGLDASDGVLDHLEELLVRHGRVVA